MFKMERALLNTEIEFDPRDLEFRFDYRNCLEYALAGLSILSRTEDYFSFAEHHTSVMEEIMHVVGGAQKGGIDTRVVDTREIFNLKQEINGLLVERDFQAFKDQLYQDSKMIN